MRTGRDSSEITEWDFRYLRCDDGVVRLQFRDLHIMPGMDYFGFFKRQMETIFPLDAIPHSPWITGNCLCDAGEKWRKADLAAISS